ncbi:Acetyltransferase (GNAT) family protein [Lentzea albida]|uniref:Acetyltransferase (GNAT) family protein n=1 Tax=Lentzea albida TaxID=65499 RepID=A0A1H9F6A8_9PSEU|nr:Acetyltransferase (GNAT) family protein [Lentzea albida]
MDEARGVTGAAPGRTGRLSLLGAWERPVVRRGPGRREVRDYEQADEVSWLRCRVLGLLGTTCYDDVWPAKRRADLELVAVDGDVIGVLDVSVPGPEATIETVVVHPDLQGQGVATALLAEAVRRLERFGVRRVDAWTREDVPTLRWLARNGFVEDGRHLEVYASPAEVGTVLSAKLGLEPVGAVLRARIEREAELRQRFERVHVCRRVVRDLRP